MESIASRAHIPESSDAAPAGALFAVLDVDSRPELISFTGPDATPLVKNILLVETVLAPTKSCTVTFKNGFYVDGKNQETGTYTATVTVPAFRDGVIGTGGLLTQELAHLDWLDETAVSQALAKYRYDPQSIQKHYQ